MNRCLYRCTNSVCVRFVWGKWCLLFTWSASPPRIAFLISSHRLPRAPALTSASTLPQFRGLSELTQTSQDEKTLNLNVILLGPQRIHCVGIQKDIPGCERGSFLFFAHWPPPSLSGAACLSLTTAACCLWRPGVSGAAPDICRPWALAPSHIHTHTLESCTKNDTPPPHLILSAGEELDWISQALTDHLLSRISCPLFSSAPSHSQTEFLFKSIST